VIIQRARLGDTDMGHRFAEIAFTPNVKAAQEQNGSRRSNTRFEGGEPLRHRLGDREAQFIAARDSFYMATVSETGWPYIQHRGGPAGLLRVLDDKTIGFADFSGNRQYITIGNLAGNDRVSLFLMDYANRARLKILGHARVVPPDDAVTMRKLTQDGAHTRVERGILIGIEAFDWNCSQNITERYTLADVEEATTVLRARIVELEAKLAQATQP
jgi:predicted pyridoxine 5'-phosphate oxidase superfamily flavin-nucleotide-binding protein